MKLNRRFIAVLFCLVLFASTLCIPVSAAENAAVAGQLTGMSDKAMRYYRFFGRIGCWFAIVSLASSGFKILHAVFIGGMMDEPRVKKQIIATFLAIGVYFVIPYVIGYVIGVVSSLAWKPSPPTNNPWIDLLD